MAISSYPRSRGLSDSVQQAQNLLERYPDLSEHELASLIDTFARFPLLDFGILAADERLGDKLSAFHADRGGKLGLGLSALLCVVAVAALTLGIVASYLIVP